ncbi:MAG: diaminopimelate dehydrogenase [Prevotellaceae bacterium]|nr:diaminopimelate dehydrogenase [Candidatus Colivivens equi]
MIKVAIVGFGNIGRRVLEALEASPDMECVGIVRRELSAVSGYKVVTDIKDLEEVDVAILSTPSRKVEEYAKRILAMGINTVDSFDIHTQIPQLRTTLDSVAKAHDAVAVISAGWDPGSDSVVRTLMESLAPRGITYTNFGPGRSMGHTVAVRAISGVRDALSITIPIGTGLHRRMVYVELEEGADFNKIEQAITTDPYFVNDETHVQQVDSVATLNDVGHGVNLVRKGVSGKTHNQLLEFNMKINNPALTAQVMVNMARASLRQKSGAYTMIEIPVIDMLPGEKEDIIRHLV